MGVVEDRPDRYAPIDRTTLESRVKALQQGRLTPTDLNEFSAQVHNVSVIAAPDTSSVDLPATSRPKGSLQLDKVVIVDSTAP